MRLTKKIDNEYSVIAYDINLMKCGNNAINKLGQLEDIEDELGIDLITLFDSKYTGAAFEMELEKDDKTIYFDGDTFFGHYSANEFLELIKDMLSMYKQLIKLGH